MLAINTSETIGKIAGAIAKAQLAAKHAVKDSTNPHFRNHYASLAACIEASKAFNEQEIAVIQPTTSSEENCVTVLTILMHSSGEYIESTLTMPVSKRDAQGFGSAISYARRYALMSALGLAADDDDGEAASASLAPALKASVENVSAENAFASRMRGSQKMGDLLEVWTEATKKLKGDPSALKRLSIVKDECKSKLGSNATSA